jgi:nucleotidyltransferase/DNA polymerase involved in DNA repair
MIKTSSRSRKQFRTSDERQLKDLAGVGPATLEDLALLGVHSITQLAEQNGTELYEKLCSVTGVQHDVCCLDVFRCAVAQARDPELPEEQRNWWYWSRLRKKKVSAWSLQ